MAEAEEKAGAPPGVTPATAPVAPATAPETPAQAAGPAPAVGPVARHGVPRDVGIAVFRARRPPERGYLMAVILLVAILLVAVAVLRRWDNTTPYRGAARYAGAPCNGYAYL